MTTRILAPQDKDLRIRFRDILEAALVPSILDETVLEPNKWIVWTEMPETLDDKGENIDVLRSQKDVVTRVSGTTFERINAWIITTIGVNENKVGGFSIGQKSDLSGRGRGQGKVTVDRKFRLLYFKGFGEGEMRTRVETDAVRRRFNESAKLDFNDPQSRFLIGHSGLQEVFSDSGEYGDTMAYLKAFEITVYLYETYN